MKRIPTIIAFGFIFTLLACGGLESSSDLEANKTITPTLTATSLLATAPKTWKWQPWNIPENCVFYTTTPVSNTYVFRPYVVPCNSIDPKSPTKPTVTITKYDGAAWNGEYAPVQIKTSWADLCLHNPENYVKGIINKGLEWRPCLDVHVGIENRRQIFVISRGANGIVSLHSEYQYATGIPNPTKECVRQQTPTELTRSTCSGIGFWMMTPAT